jgi:hypothetical protein
MLPNVVMLEYYYGLLGRDRRNVNGTKGSKGGGRAVSDRTLGVVGTPKDGLDVRECCNVRHVNTAYCRILSVKISAS